MTSTLTWLDYSQDSRRRVLDAIDLFRERETRDELGLGSIRDGFAGLFSPGTSTIQTRARYFLLIPWLYQEVESRTSTRPAAVRARDAELDLVEALLADGDEKGLIGSMARRGLKRLPSSVYWQGLHTWRVRPVPVAQQAYHQWIDVGAALAIDTSEEGESVRGIWHSGLPEPPPGFPGEASLALLAGEADYLAERLFQYWPDSLLSWLIKDARSLEDVRFPWLHPGVERMPGAIREQLDHARCFSEAIHGAQLLYNFLLARSYPSGPQSADVWAYAAEEWAAMMAARDEQFASWDNARFWEIVESSGARVRPPTRRFVNDWIKLLRGGAAALDVTSDMRFEKLVRDQEIQVKGGQARLTNRSMLEAWGGDSGSQQLSYRWDITSGYAQEIASARDA
jgi:hypothetical protein